MRSTPVPPSDRRVGRLHIRAAAEEDARRAATLLADALHTASLPVADGGQMLVVRKLALGRISSRASPATLALRVEQALREARVSAVPFDRPGAPGANAVVFPGRAEALAALARRHARGLGTGAWFWARVLPAWHDGPPSRGERWRSLLEAAHALPEAAPTAAAVIREAVRAGVEDELLNAIPPGRGADWLQAAGWDATPPAAAGEPGPAPGLDARHEEILRRWQRRWGPAAERLLWLGTLLAVLDQPARAGDPHLPARLAARLAWMEAPAGARSRRTVGEPPLAGPVPHAAPRRDTEGQPGRSDDGNATPPFRVEVRDPPGPEPPPDPSRSGERTNYAGLLFLVAVLERLGFETFLITHPALLDAGFPVRLLRFVGGRVGLPPHDPLALALGEPTPVEPTLPAWEPPDPVRVLLARPPSRARLDGPLGVWLTAVRRWCRRHAHLGLVNLVRRAGRVSFSPTHLDLAFPLADADLRVRRAALDTDPGWVPWLGRVVRFHYLDRHEPPRD